MRFGPFDDYLVDDPGDDPGSFVDVPPGQIADLKTRAALNGQSVVVTDGLVFVVN